MRVTFLFVLLASQSIFADSYTADLQEVDRFGYPVVYFRSQNQTLTSHETKKGPESFYLQEIIRDPRDFNVVQIEEWNFSVTDTVDVGCGSKKYIAKDAGKKATLWVIDHRRRICRDAVPAQWEVTLLEKPSRRFFQGNPKEDAVQCPVVSCAEVPDNCELVTSNERNDEGCPLHPCGLLLCLPN